ncbi:Protein CBG00197 [Caenorhabditis briggsae]|uniref:Protein CBG00197 n=1 Tax=Caenorhabditis briggsae TaxID=6238 RepID=A8WMG2_CAEBR|nr:Protein CBG00197 [Caenorhabditis briggsae]CAP21667.2 Protein CBG00197 [Caenorhabditis briggsae]
MSNSDVDRMMVPNGFPMFLKNPTTMIPNFHTIPFFGINPLIHLVNQMILAKKGQFVPMKQHSLLSLPHPQQILACANDPGVLLNTFQLPTGCFTTLLCFKPGGFKAGTNLELPDAWWRFAKESSHSANIVHSKVVADIECGAEIVICRTPPEDRKSEVEEPPTPDDVAAEDAPLPPSSTHNTTPCHSHFTGLSRNAIDYAFIFFMSTKTTDLMFAPFVKNRLASQAASTSVLIVEKPSLLMLPMIVTSDDPILLSSDH